VAFSLEEISPASRFDDRIPFDRKNITYSLDLMSAGAKECTNVTVVNSVKNAKKIVNAINGLLRLNAAKRVLTHMVLSSQADQTKIIVRAPEFHRLPKEQHPLISVSTTHSSRRIKGGGCRVKHLRMAAAD
jgi:hypothetical protein